MPLKKQTVTEFRNYLAGCPLKEIKDVCESANITLTEGFTLPQSGQRRALANAYLNTIDLSDPASVAKFLDAIESVLVKLAIQKNDYADSPRAQAAEDERNKLLQWLKRDGFVFQDGRVQPADSDFPKTLAASPPTDVTPNVSTAPAATTLYHPKTLISYSWDDPAHKQWVKDLAAKLRSHGVNATLDDWALAAGDQLARFMEDAVRENEHVLIICTPKYKVKSDTRSGGVGFEGNIMTAEVLNGQNDRKFIPILREGEWREAAPSWLAGKIYLDFRGNPYLEDIYEKLLNNLYKTTEKAPPLGSRPIRERGDSMVAHVTSTPPPTGRRSLPFGAAYVDKHGNPTLTHPDDVIPPPVDTSPIKITGIIFDQIGQPTNDGTHGSALYSVPLQLSRRPSDDWARLFVQTWDRPPRFSTMHRPGIARVVGDRVILQHTTVDEIEKFHRDTLKLVLDHVNMAIAEHEAKKQKLEEKRAQEQRDHDEAVREAAKRITFD